jgi:hypothetical protein
MDPFFIVAIVVIVAGSLVIAIRGGKAPPSPPADAGRGRDGGPGGD